MPLPSASLGACVGGTLAEEEGEEGPVAAFSPPAAPPGAVSFAALAKHGFAATGPSLAEAFGPRPGGVSAGGTGGPGPATAAPPAPRGVWGGQAAATAVGSPAPPTAWGGAGGGAAAPGCGAGGGNLADRLAGLALYSDAGAADASSVASGSKGGKKGKQVLFSTAQRRY